MLDPASESDLFVLHCVFLGVLNSHLEAFVNGWNHHPLRTERNWSPHKIWINGMIDPGKRGQTAVHDIVNGITDYGVDYYGPLPDEETHTVEVPETLCPLPEHLFEQFINSLRANVVNIDEAVSVYIEARQLLVQLIQFHSTSSDSEQ